MVNINEWNYHTIISVVSSNSAENIYTHTHSHTYWQQSDAAFDICSIWTGKWCSFMTIQFLSLSLSLCPFIPVSLTLAVLLLSIFLYNGVGERVCLLSTAVRFFAWFPFVICWFPRMFTWIFIWYCHCWQIEHAFLAWNLSLVSEQFLLFASSMLTWPNYMYVVYCKCKCRSDFSTNISNFTNFREKN